MNSLEEKIKLPPTETISRCYQPQGNRKVIRILTVTVYVLCVSLAAIMLSLYYIFIWDPTIRPFVSRGNNCEKVVIPEKIAIRLINSSEVTAEQFYRHILDQYRILNQLQFQRQQFLQNQQKQLQQLAASGNTRFKEIFATATIIQTNPKDPINKPVTPTNGTFLLDSARHPISISEVNSDDSELRPVDTLTILDTAPVYTKRKSHRKHNLHHRRNRNYSKKLEDNTMTPNHNKYAEAALNPPSSIIHKPLYTSLPIPLILNSNEDKRQPHYSHYHGHGHSIEKHPSRLMVRKQTISPTLSGYDKTETDAEPIMLSSSSNAQQSFKNINPLLHGELIFEK